MFRTTDNTPVVQANETILIVHHLVELYNIIWQKSEKHNKISINACNEKTKTLWNMNRYV